MAKLPDIPKGKELEDYVAASLQCAGYFVEKSLIERGAAEVLELDMIATDYRESTPTPLLVEVKSGDWGFGDIFKLLGWKIYLSGKGLGRTYLVASRLKDNFPIDFVRAKCTELGVGIVAVDGHERLNAALAGEGLLRAEPAHLEHSLWRFSLWLERLTVDIVSSNRKAGDGRNGPQQIYEYQELIRNGLLLATDLRERLASLYSAHLEHPWLAKAVAREMDGEPYNAEADPGEGAHWLEAVRECDHPIVQAALYFQHKARLGVLKGAVDYALLEDAGDLPPDGTIEFMGFDLPQDYLPASFHNGVRQIRKIGSKERIPALWQSFMWKWGGFFLSESEPEERAQLAAEVGMGLDDANQALGLFDVLFPIPGSTWYAEFQGTRILKLFPCPFRGIGAFMRLAMAEADDYRAFKTPAHPYLAVNLQKWHNAAAGALAKG